MSARRISPTALRVDDLVIDCHIRSASLPRTRPSTPASVQRRTSAWRRMRFHAFIAVLVLGLGAWECWDIITTGRLGWQTRGAKQRKLLGDEHVREGFHSSSYIVRPSLINSSLPWDWDAVLRRAQADLNKMPRKLQEETFNTRYESRQVQALEHLLLLAAEDTFYGCSRYFGLSTRGSPLPELPSESICKRRWRVLFITSSRFPEAAFLRGSLMAQALVDLGQSTAIVDEEKFDGSGIAQDVCVCIGECQERSIQLCQKAGAKVVWDTAGHHMRLQELWRLSSKVDMFITNSRLHAAALASYSKAVPIYDQHSNDGGVRRTAWDRPVTHVALLVPAGGLRGTAVKLLTELWDLAKQRGWTVVEGVGPNGMVGPDLHKHHKYMDHIDAAVVWPLDQDYQTVCGGASASELLTWWSHGIPTVFYPTQPAVELALAAGYPMVASLEEEVVPMLEQLVASPQLRKELALAGLKAAKELRTASVAKQVVAALCRDEAESGDY
eukprot:jgi/Chlat1/5523/Chrsp369S00406